MSITASCAQAPPSWIVDLGKHFCSTYLDDRGLLVISIGADRSIIRAEPVIGDFGDILPFLWHFGMQDFVDSQLKRAHKRLRDGLYVRDGRIRLFLNHDWLLGLLDIYRQTHDEEILKLARLGAVNIANGYFCNDILIDELPHKRDWMTYLAPASPFNGGYIELWVDLHKYTNDEKYLVWARRLASGWIDSQSFKEHGVFSRVFSARFPLISIFLGRIATLKSRLFKDNTNLVWGILSLYKATGEIRWKNALEHWVAGFEKSFFNEGKVNLMVNASMSGYEASIKAAFSSMDLLCDLHWENIEQERTLKLATAIADYWLSQQWTNGLFPEVPGGDTDHLDANVDLVVALAKLYDLTRKQNYLEALTLCRQSILSLHATDVGYCLAVDRAGLPSDSRIIVKYQGLVMKLAILPDNPIGLMSDLETMELLRDR